LRRQADFTGIVGVRLYHGGVIADIVRVHVYHGGGNADFAFIYADVGCVHADIRWFLTGFARFFAGSARVRFYHGVVHREVVSNHVYHGGVHSNIASN
jgi:hypothetical protein